MKQKIYKLVEKGSHGSQINLIFDYLIVTLIVFNVIAIALGTLEGLTPEFLSILKLFEIVSIMIFTIEYLMRLYVSDLTHPSNLFRGQFPAACCEKCPVQLFFDTP